MSHNESALAPYITEHTTALATAGAGQSLVIKGFGLGLSTVVDIPSALGVETARAFTKTGPTAGVLTITLTVETFTEGTTTNRTVAISMGGVPCLGVGASNGAITVVHGALFDPLSVSGARLWLDAADEDTFTKAANRISRWDDKSGATDTHAGVGSHHHFVQSTASDQPTYVPDTAGGGSGAFSSKGGAVRFGEVSGAETWLSGEYAWKTAASGTATLFFVISKSASVPANGGYGENFYTGAGWYVWKHHDGSSWTNDRFRISSSSDLSATSTTVIGNKYLLTVTHNGTGVADTIRVNGSEEASADINANLGYSNTSHKIGNNGSATYSEAEIAEVLFYDSALSSSDRDDIEAYLNSKWGIY